MEQEKKEFIDELFKVDFPQLSSFMFDHIRTIKSLKIAPDLIKHELLGFSRFLDLMICKLGWIEHTGDWDPYLIFQLKDGTTFSTPNGYYVFKVKENTIEIEAPGFEEWDEEGIDRRFWNKEVDIIPIDLIQEVQLMR